MVGVVKFKSERSWQSTCNAETISAELYVLTAAAPTQFDCTRSSGRNCDAVSLLMPAQLGHSTLHRHDVCWLFHRHQLRHALTVLWTHVAVSAQDQHPAIAMSLPIGDNFYVYAKLNCARD